MSLLVGGVETVLLDWYELLELLLWWSDQWASFQQDQRFREVLTLASWQQSAWNNYRFFTTW